jgi:hypothetical protein
VYYLYPWLQDKSDLVNIVSCLVFYESSTPFHFPSPTGSIMTHQTLGESVNALAVACMPDPSQVKLTEKNGRHKLAIIVMMLRKGC